jgi:hypothetical protein
MVSCLTSGREYETLIMRLSIARPAKALESDGAPLTPWRSGCGRSLWLVSNDEAVSSYDVATETPKPACKAVHLIQGRSSRLIACERVRRYVAHASLLRDGLAIPAQAFPPAPATAFDLEPILTYRDNALAHPPTSPLARLTLLLFVRRTYRIVSGITP